MSRPQMMIVAGPPGAGKSSIFSLGDFATNVFNADDRAAELNGGSYQNIPTSVRVTVNREFEQFVHSNIAAGASFALETTLRSTITFEQARLAHKSGFRVTMRYLALDTVDAHIERVKRRASRGGHSASETTLRRIHASSLSNLSHALDPEKSGIEIVRIYDNSRLERTPRLVLLARSGKIVRIADNFPAWLQEALGWDDRTLELNKRSAMRATN